MFITILYNVRPITYDIAIHAKITQTLSPPAPCSLLPCNPNDKYLTGHDITPLINLGVCM